jgi:hypothetical protein
MDASARETYDDVVIAPTSTFRLEGDAPAAFSVAEYNAVRNEIDNAIGGQQRILAWSVAGIGVLAAAVTTLGGSGAVAHAAAVRFGVLGIALPALAIGACFAWLGELYRMNRAARYLRSVERTTWPADRRDATRLQEAWVADTPLLYNNWLAFGQPLGSRVLMGYAGALLIYGSTVAVSLGTFSYLWIDHRLSVAAHTVGIVWSSFVALTYASAVIAQVRELARDAGLSGTELAKGLTGQRHNA